MFDIDEMRSPIRYADQRGLSRPFSLRAGMVGPGELVKIYWAWRGVAWHGQPSLATMK